MHPRGVKFFTLAFIFVIVFFPTRAFGYDTRVAHPNIAMLAARLYNTQFPDKQLSDSDIAAIEAGAIDEDMPTRWYNHFYDPVHNIGWTAARIGFRGERLDKAYADAVRLLLAAAWLSVRLASTAIGGSCKLYMNGYNA